MVLRTGPAMVWAVGRSATYGADLVARREKWATDSLSILFREALHASLHASGVAGQIASRALSRLLRLRCGDLFGHRKSGADIPILAELIYRDFNTTSASSISQRDLGPKICSCHHPLVDFSRYAP